MPCRFEHQELQAHGGIHGPSVSRRGGDDHVVAGTDFQISEDGLECATACEDIDQLVALGVPVEAARLARAGPAHRHLGVAHEEMASLHQIVTVSERAEAEVIGE